MTNQLKAARWRTLANSPAESDQAALKRLYLAILSLDPSGTAPQRWSNRWKPVLNALEMAFDGRLYPEHDTAVGVKNRDTR